jgi:hypothetical protein
MQPRVDGNSLVPVAHFTVLPVSCIVLRTPKRNRNDGALTEHLIYHVNPWNQFHHYLLEDCANGENDKTA